MHASRFVRYELRTNDQDAARVFYTDVLGAALFDGGDVTLGPIPPQAAARGVPPHWLGTIAASDAERATQRIVVAGGQRLGPALRDPFGAVLAVNGEAETTPSRDRVAWHQLHTTDHERAFALYADAFGWKPRALVDLGPESGLHRTFAWDEAGAPVGAITNSARLRGVHPHWLFYFHTADFDAALAKVRAHGGKVIGSFRTPEGPRVAPCDDPQGGAFGLWAND